MRTGLLLATIACALVAGVSASTAKQPQDYASVALDVLPPGQSGSLSFPPTATDQAQLYDGLTPLFSNVTTADLPRYFKSEHFGLDGAKPTRTEHPRAGVTILRDRWDVPHVYAKTRFGVEFGAGYATAEDRLLLMQLLRGPGRIAALDVPGIDPFAVAFAAQEFVPSAQTEAILAKQIDLAARSGPKARQLVKDVDAYVAGINALIKDQGDYVPHWTRNDVIAIAALIGARFGVGGGDEARRSELLSALDTKLGAEKGRSVWNDLRSEQDLEAPVSVDGTFTVHEQAGAETGNVVLDDGSLKAAPEIRHANASNALLIAAKRSKNGHPLFVAGPQVGYAFPELLLEEELHGGGIDTRGAAFPGISFYVLIGRGKDFSWSATSSGSDIVDQFAETLCGGDDLHYLYKGACRAMERIDAGTLKGKNGVPDRQLAFYDTVHGPVDGYATVDGVKVAIASDRSTRGRELLAAIPFQDLNTNVVHDARSFIKAMSTFELTFNWLYADDKNIAMFSSGRVPIRATGVSLGLPTKGTGEYDWRGFVPAKDHPQGIDPRGGTILNWNNKPARGWPAADDTWDYQSTYRVDMLRDALPSGKLTLAQVVAAMNKAATQDIRSVVVEPTLSQVLEPRGSDTIPPSVRDQKMLALLDAWHAAGSSRLDRDLDGKTDDPGAAIMDAAWPKLADAVLSPVLGPLTDQLAQLVPRNNQANSGGSAYAAGWYGYVWKDLRAALGQPVQGPYSTHYCGNGDLAACRASLWAALDAAGNELQAAQGPDPGAWRADATNERIAFGLLPLTMRWTNRPTFQQAMTFTSHRPR